MMTKPEPVIEHKKYSAQHFGKENYELLKDLCLEEEFRQIMRFSQGQICFDKYAGVFQLKNGTYIEVLPKTYSCGEEIDTARQIFKKLILKMQGEYYKQISDTDIDNQTFPVLEIFITLFLNELDILFKRGLKKNYVDISENSLFIKGKIKVNENIRYNLTHKERTFVEYSEFTENIPENKILKKAVIFLKDRTNYFPNIKRLRQALFNLEEVDIPNNIDYEFSQIHLSRLNSYYQRPLDIAKIFLKGSSFIPQAGNNNLVSLMFPLNKLFEDYVLSFFLNKFNKLPIKIKPQDPKYNLLKEPKRFKIIPDIVIQHKYEDRVAIIDTKWKLIDENNYQDKYNVAQADLYQLYAYGKKYQQDSNNVELFLIYPKTDKFTEIISWQFEENLNINLVPFDLIEDILLDNGKLSNFFGDFENYQEVSVSNG